MRRSTMSFVLAVLVTVGLLSLPTLSNAAAPFHRPRQLVDIATGTSSSAPSGFAPVAGRTVFAADTSRRGRELWITDGTPPGTRLLKDINTVKAQPNAFENLGSQPFALTAFKGKVFFGAVVGTNAQLWVTDGTTAGTRRLSAGLLPGRALTIIDLTVVGSRLYFVVRYASGRYDLWRTDLTTAGTTRIRTLDAGVETTGRFVSFGGKLWFAGYSAATGWELWTSDGTAAGTTVFLDALAGARSTQPADLTVAGGLLYFSRLDASGLYRDLFVSDGTRAGTRQVSTAANRPVRIASITALGTRVVFSASRADAAVRQPWISDGTAGGTQPLTGAGWLGTPGPSSLVAAGKRVFFVFGDDDIHGNELWATDGTTAGTSMVRDIRPGIAESHPLYLTALGSRVVFVADDGLHGAEAWTSDGTSAGTRLLRDIGPATAGGSVRDLTVSRGMAFFAATTGAGSEPWVWEPGPTYLSWTTISASATVAYGKGTAVTVRVASGAGLSSSKVSLYDGATKLGTRTLTGGSTTFTLAKKTKVGAHALTARYPGGGEVRASTSGKRTVTVTKAKPAVTSKLSSTSVRATGHAKLAVTVKVAGLTPTGTVKARLTKSGTAARTVSAKLTAARKGKITLTLPKLARGSWSATATYAGTTTIAVGSASTKKLTVTK